MKETEEIKEVNEEALEAVTGGRPEIIKDGTKVVIAHRLSQVRKGTDEEKNDLCFALGVPVTVTPAFEIPEGKDEPKEILLK